MSSRLIPLTIEFIVGSCGHIVSPSRNVGLFLLDDLGSLLRFIDSLCSLLSDVDSLVFEISDMFLVVLVDIEA